MTSFVSVERIGTAIISSTVRSPVPVEPGEITGLHCLSERLTAPGCASSLGESAPAVLIGGRMTAP